MHHTLKGMHNHISNRNISCPQGISVKVMRTASLSLRVTSSRCLAAMRAICKESDLPKHRQNIEQVWQQRKWSIKNLSAWLARCPWAPASWASAWQQRKTIKNRQLVKSWQTHCEKPAMSKAMPALQPQARRSRRMRIVPGRKRAKHASNASGPFCLNMHKAARPLPTLGQSETCQNMPASLLDRFEPSDWSYSLFLLRCCVADLS